MQAWRIRVVVLLILSCAFGGCTGKGGGSDVTGSILLDGQPLAGAEVQFISQDKTNPVMHSATTDSAGNFTLKGDRNIPVKPGAYLVLANKLAVQGNAAKGAMVNTVPLVYQDRTKTPLQADIQPGVNKLPPFELKSSGKR